MRVVANQEQNKPTIKGNYIECEMWNGASKYAQARSWVYLLNKRERKALEVIVDNYYQKYSQDAVYNPDLVAFLGDNPKKRLCWSAVSRKIPTLRRNAGKMFVPSLRRWMVPKEKLLLMGFPVVPSVAMSMGVPVLAITDNRRASYVAGNCMHFSCVLLIQFLALVCFQPCTPMQASRSIAGLGNFLLDSDSEAPEADESELS